MERDEQRSGNKKLGYIYLIACLSDINIDCLQSNTWVNWL